MKRDKVETLGLDSFIANISPLLDCLSDQVVTMTSLLSACSDPIKDDDELQVRMALIDELYSHADSEGHVAAKFAEMVADRVYEYERETVLVPMASQSEALRFLMELREVKQRDLSNIASQSAISEILNGKRKMTVVQIKGFSEFFKVPVEYFMHGID
ncbi:transcriptional regulator [Pantoea sp. Tr-811]|uniref:helix-turn-helix domain-containing protein n=1 Tax=Pantoea sp. Tr-811 TaxID=2608361 RepID=UPI0014232E98|nr:transcriptional regulator [Pantoea sp. Tr-811]NIF26344.1 transcriptional regulator [Pantoea sp. Tr-811]